MMYAQANILIRKFGMCSSSVKITPAASCYKRSGIQLWYEATTQSA
jgi:hypothetical protein